MRLESPAFGSGGLLPKRHCGDGDNVSPPLSFIEAPAAARELALTCVDPDAGGWAHWLVYGLPATCGGLAEGAPRRMFVAGGRQGLNGWGALGWGGPFPPKGPAHRYVFTLWALKKPLNLEAGAGLGRLRRVLAAEALAQAELVAAYRR